MLGGRVYLDTSAYLAIRLGEEEAGWLMPQLAAKVVCSSTLLLIEAERTIVRLARESTITAADYQVLIQRLQLDADGLLLRHLTPELCLSGRYPAVKTPRSSDLVHLRTAEWFSLNGGLEAFLTCDLAQRDAANELGLPQG